MSGPDDGIVSNVLRIRTQLSRRTPAALAGLPSLLLQALKVQEEAGEIAEAMIGAVGANPRKGITHTMVDVADEAFDVAMSALVLAEEAHPGYLVARMSDRLKMLADRARRFGAPDVTP